MLLHILLYMDCVFFSQRAERRGASAEAQTRTGDAKAQRHKGPRGCLANRIGAPVVKDASKS